MTDDIESENPVDSTPTEDPRFEVKWRKKEQARTASAPETQTSDDAPSDDAAELRRQVSEQQERIQDLQDKWHRASADLVNLRRRTEQEKAENEQFASMLLVAELLPVLDNFERALATIPGNLTMLTWVQGVMLIERHLRAILEQRGLEAIEAQGKPFSPHFHEAVSDRETSEAAPGTVVQEYQRGYSMHGRVLRPSLVELAKEPAQPTDTPEPTDESPPPETTTTSDANDIADTSETENTGP